MGWASYKHKSALGAATRVAVIFSAFSVLWIALTDRILGWLVRDPEQLIQLATIKGMVYVLLMGMLVFWLSYVGFVDREGGEGAKGGPATLQGTQPLGLWAPLTIFGISTGLVVLVGYQAFRFQGIAIVHAREDAATSLARTAWIGVALGVIFLALAGILLTLWWKREQLRVRGIHAHLEAERLSLKQQLELLSEYTNDIVIILDEHRRIVGANDRALEAYGYTREELLALTVDDLRSSEGAAGVPEQFGLVMSAGSLKFESAHCRKDGARIPVEVSARRFEQGGHSFMQSVIRDISERQAARRALQESESQFRSIFEQTDVGIVECTHEGRFVCANPKFCEFIGYSEEELKQLTFLDITQSEHRDEDIRELLRVYYGKRGEYRSVKQYLRKDGALVWGRTSVSLMQELDGKPRQLLAAIQDIDAWRHAEEKLQESETLIQRILDTTPNLIHIYDLSEKRYVFITRKVSDILGRTPDEIQAMGSAVFEKLLHPADLEQLEAHIHSIVTARYPDVFELNCRMKHVNGEWRWLRSRDVLFARSKDGTPAQILGTTEDITEHKLAEDALRENQFLLENAQRLARIGTYSWDILKDVWDASPELESIFGIDRTYPRDFKGWVTIVAPEWRQRMADYVQEILACHRPFDLDYQILRPSDGGFRWVHGQGEVERDAQGNPLRMWGVIHDITDHKRDQESLQRLATLLNRSQVITHVGGYESDLRTGVIYWSEEMYRIQDMTPGALVPSQEKALSMYTPEWQPTIREAVRRLIEQGEGYDLELEKLTETGRRIWVRNIAEAVQENGQTVKIVGALQDITEARQAQEALQEQRRRLSDIIEGTRVGTWEWNLQTGEVILNERWAEIVGCTLAELEPTDIRTWMDLVHPADLEASNALLDQHFSGELPYYECECRLRHRDGSWIWVLDRGRVIQWTEDGKPLCMSGTHTDITERKVVEEILQRSERNYHTLFDQMLDGLAIHEIITSAAGHPVDYRFLSVNPAFETMTGLSAASVVGRTVKEVMPGIEQHWIEIYGRVALTGESVRFEQHSLSLDKHYHVVAFRPQTGQFACIFMDITARMKAEEEIRCLNQELEKRVLERTAQLNDLLETQTRTNAELEAFSYSVSHDLRAPLRGIDGFSQALMEDYGERMDEEARHYLQRIRNGTQRMGQIIDDLLRLSKVSRGELNKQRTDLTVLARRVLAELGQGHPERKVAGEVQEQLFAQADPRLIQVVVENLVGNAWKYTTLKPEARIEVGQVQIEGRPTYFVRDNGAGFDMQFAGRLFVPFQRLHAAAEFEGSGIGLAIVLRIIQRHGGRIWAEAQPDQGATFYFSLPD